MDDLAEELGMSKKNALRAHYRSKSVLLEAVLGDKFNEVEAELRRMTSGGMPDIVSTMRQLLTCLQRQLQEIQQPFVRDIHRHAPEMFRLI